MATKKQRIFYGVQLLEPILAASLDTIRFLAEPGFYRRSHITVRGPYLRSLNKRELDVINRKFSPELRNVEIVGSGTFFFGDQNTVILKCEIPGIRDVWMKPSFSDGIPYVTLYDGGSRSDATTIHHILRAHRWAINVRVSEVCRLETKIDPLEDFMHLFHESRELREAVFEGEDLVERVGKLHMLDRTLYVERVCRFIERKFSRNSILAKNVDH